MLKKLWPIALIPTGLRRYSISLLVIASIALTCCFRAILAQESGNVVVRLQINQPYEQTMMVAWIEFDKGRSNSSIDNTRPDVIRHGTLPGGLRVVVETIGESPTAYKVKIDTDRDGDLADEKPILINLGASVTVEVTRRRENGGVVTLPYTLTYSGQETFHWRPGYVAEGRLKVGKCEASVKVLDVNGDGVFDRLDFRNATTINIDDGTGGDIIRLDDPRVIRHSDGRIEIPEELRRQTKRKWLKGEEIIEFCGGFYEVGRIEPDGSALTLAKTDQRVPGVGEPLPSMVMTTFDGKEIKMADLKGTATLLDFWASWCRPCVEKFADVKQIVAEHKGGIKVIAINVDESGRLPLAHKVIKEYKLSWPHVARGEGERDPLWKLFGSMSSNGLQIPLYVLVDAKGIIRYAGNGAKNLSELRAKIMELEVNK